MIHNSPLVSVIIPLYNADRYISEALQSVINQTYPEIEILVINDGSTDNSLEITRKFESDKVKVYSQSNKGASAARNYGLKEAKGKYIQFLDADDYLSSNKIEEQVRILEADDSKVALCPVIHFFDGEEVNEKLVSNEWFYGSFDNPVQFLIRLYGGEEIDGGMIQPNSWLTPKKIIDKAGLWNEQLSVDDDGEFFCRVVLAGSGIVCCKNALNFYRKYRKNIGLSSKSDEKAFRSIFKALELKQQHLSNFSNDPRYKKAFARAFKRLAVQTYPQLSELTKNSEIYLNILGGSDHNVTLGGGGIELIKKIFGWKTARLIQHYFKEIRKFVEITH